MLQPLPIDGVLVRYFIILIFFCSEQKDSAGPDGKKPSQKY